MKLLVTGASGLLGTKLCQLAIARNHEVHAAYYQHSPLYGTPVALNILDPKAVQKTIDKTKPSVAVHAAAMTDVDKCEIEKELSWKTNVDATENLVRLCKKRGVFLLYVSTDYVFDGEKGMYKENDKTAPVNYYGFTKLKAEEAVRNLRDYCIVRGSVVYGSIPATGKINFALWLIDKLRKKEVVRIVTDQWNSPTLNTNMAEMILEVLEKRKNGTFHLSGATRLSRYEFAKHIAEAFNLDAKFMTAIKSKHINWVAKRPKDSSLNVNKAEETLLCKPLEIGEALEELRKENA